MPRRGIGLRLFLTSWVIFSLHFATNVVREHYPAFALIDKGNFQVDEYEGFHWDIFRHTDGHCYIGNQVLGSVIAAGPLWLFDPLLDRIEARTVAKRAAESRPAEDFKTEYPLRQAFMKKVRDRGLDERFGAVTVVTSVFLMAPLAAACVVFLWRLLEQRGVERRRAILLALAFGFATPLFYRAAFLNHNVFLMISVFLSFYLIWPKPGRDFAPSFRARLGGGFFAGFSLALDYAGVIPLLLIYGYLVFSRRRAAGGLLRSFVESLAFVAGSVPPVIFLCWSQWWMFGDPFKPGQYWMPKQNDFVDQGWRGMVWPRWELIAENLFSRAFGMFTFGPLLIVGVVAAFRRSGAIFGRRERLFVAAFFVAFLLFNAANLYSKLQANTGFRYLLPLVPFVFLEAAEILAKIRERLLWLLLLPAFLHEWVLAMARFTPVDKHDQRDAMTESWRRVLADGVTFPWLTTARQALGARLPWILSPAVPYGILAIVGLSLWLVWRIGAKAESSGPCLAEGKVAPGKPAGT